MQIRDSLIELRETRLYGALKVQDDEYAEWIEQFVAGITPIMATTVQYFPFYTRHDAKIAELMSKLENDDQGFSSPEVMKFMLN